MDMSSPSWFTELEMDELILMDKFDDILHSFNEECGAIHGDGFQISPENGSLLLLPQLEVEEHQQNPYVSNFDQSVPLIMDFGDKSSQQCVYRSQLSDGEAKVKKEAKKASPRTRSSQSQYDHVMTERNRRQQLSQQFIELSTIVPGLKKTDKSSVLGDAIKHIEKLQEKAKILEEKARKQSIESTVHVKHSQLIIEDDNESCDVDEGGGSGNSLPEIEARVCDKSVHIRILCKKLEGVLIKVVPHIEKMNLAVISTSVSRLGNIGFYISINTEMEQEFNATMKDIVRSLRPVVLHARQ